MNAKHFLICMMTTAAATLAGMAQAQPAGDGQNDVALAAACPAALATLPERLYPAWRAIDSAAQVLVEFNLDGNVISGVKVSGGHGDYVGAVRSAVKAMTCRVSSAGPSSVRFRINFSYPEDVRSPTIALNIVEVRPQVAAR